MLNSPTNYKRYRRILKVTKAILEIIWLIVKIIRDFLMK